MKSKIHFFLKNYLGFSARESRGFILVMPAIFLIYMIPIVYNWFLQKQNEEIYQEYLLRVDSLKRAGWVPFDNNISQKKYSEDTVKKTSSYQKPRNPDLTKIPFSEADSVVLQIVPGIGQVLAGRIIKFREGIGGIHHREQLLDVYGLQPEVLEKLFEYFDFKPDIFKKVMINAIDAKELSNHPYITYGSAKVIVAYREQHGPFASSEDLLKIKIFNKEWLERLKPYLEFD